MTGAERLLAACRGRPVDATPVWFMRQSGGSLPAYLALRERHSVIEITRTPELCAEVTAGAADALGTDGAVMFADIMLPVEAMGLTLELTPTGPLLERPVRSEADLARLRPVDVHADLGFVLEAIRLVRTALADRAAVVGICGGPFTLAAYVIEGGPSRDQLEAKRIAFGAPELWAALLDRLTDVGVDYVRAQVAAGAQVVQVFDSWAGALAPADYDRLVAPWTARLLGAIRDAGAPAIHFAAAGAALVERLAAGADVVSIDAGQSLAAARRRLGRSIAVQGNLDPARLAAGWRATDAGVRAVLAESGGGPGHVFNTGHAVPRATPPEVLRDVVALVHDLTAKPIPSLEATA